MPSDPIRTLLDIRDNILLATQFVQGMTYEAFTASRLHFYATTRALEIISEASRRLPTAVREKHAHLPWRAIRDAGNVYRHDYDNVAESFVWAAVHNRLPPLLEAVELELRALDDGDS